MCSTCSNQPKSWFHIRFTCHSSNKFPHSGTNKEDIAVLSKIIGNKKLCQCLSNAHSLAWYYRPFYRNKCIQHKCFLPGSNMKSTHDENWFIDLGFLDMVKSTLLHLCSLQGCHSMAMFWRLSAVYLLHLLKYLPQLLKSLFATQFHQSQSQHISYLRTFFCLKFTEKNTQYCNIYNTNLCKASLTIS